MEFIDYTFDNAIKRLGEIDTDVWWNRGRKPQVLLIVDRDKIRRYYDYICNNYGVINDTYRIRYCEIETLDFNILIVHRVDSVNRGYRANLAIVEKDKPSISYVATHKTVLNVAKNKVKHNL